MRNLTQSAAGITMTGQALRMRYDRLVTSMSNISVNKNGHAKRYFR